MKKILNLLLCGFLLLNITGCKESQQDEVVKKFTTSKIMVTTPDNMIVASYSQYKYQDDYSKTIEMIYESKTIKSVVFSEYGIENVPDVTSTNEKNFMYEVKLECGEIDIENCRAAHNLYNEKMKESIFDLFQLTIEIVDPAN